MTKIDRVCCMCGQHKKFLARVNTGNKLYCMKCQSKITKEYGTDYWKPCSQVEFFESMSSHMREKSNRKPGNMFSSIKELFRKWDEENAKIKAAFLQFDKEEENNHKQSIE